MNSQTKTIKSYVIGFILSIVLTLIAYFLVIDNMLSRNPLLATIIILALLQMWIQLKFFLHIGHESYPRWKLLSFLFMGLVLFILVFGSLWIMSELNYNVMPQQESLPLND